MNLFSKRPKKEEPQNLTWQQKLVESMHDIVIVFAIFLMIYMLLFRVVEVRGTSMYDTLMDGDRLVLLSSSIYRDPQPGDIIVASLEDFRGGECVVKRVIAVEGQEVYIDTETATVYVDRIALDEPYIHTPTDSQVEMENPTVVKPGHVFVMGDNRQSSTDSRSFLIGQIDTREILGKAIFLLSPGTNAGKEEADYSRIGVIG